MTKKKSTTRKQKPQPTPPAPKPKHELEKLSTRQMQTALAELIEEFQLGDDWDWILIGDGSGGRNGFPIGSACIGFMNGVIEPVVWTSSGSRGTNNIAEIMAYQLPLNEIAAQGEPVEGKLGIVHVVTDSAYMVEVAKQHEPCGKNAVSLGAILAALPPWLCVSFHWKERGHTLNVAADDLSRKARLNHYRH